MKAVSDSHAELAPSQAAPHANTGDQSANGERVAKWPTCHHWERKSEGRWALRDVLQEDIPTQEALQKKDAFADHL